MKKYISILAVMFVTVGVSAQSMNLTLQEALTAGANGNRNRQMGILEQQKLAAAIQETKSSRLPTVSWNGSYNAFGTQPVGYFRSGEGETKATPVRLGGKYAFDASVTVSYPVFNSAIRSNIRIARLRERLQSETQRGSDEALVLSISDLYYSILLKQNQRQLLVQSLERNKRSQRDARALFLQGRALKTDTLATYIGVQNLYATIAEVENDQRKLELDLKQLLGLEPSVHLSLSDSLTTIHKSDLSVSSAHYAIALAERPDVKQRALELDILKEERRLRTSIFRPQVWLMGQYQVQAQAEHALLWGTNYPNTSFLGVRLNVPLYSGGKARHVNAQFRAATQQQELAVEELKAQINKELLTINADLEEAVNQWQIQLMNVQAAEASYLMHYERYKQGLSARLELSDAELSLTNAKMNAVQAVYIIRLQELRYRKAIGTLNFSISQPD